jgi:hypothetical protein
MEENMYVHTFSLRYHWWFDAGLAGLYYIAAKVKDRSPASYDSIMFQADAQGMTFYAPSKEKLKEFLVDCYEELANRYWNVSTKKQQEANDLVIYYKDKDKLDLIPRRNPTPIPGLFTKGSSFRANAEEYDKLPPEMQKRVNLFLEEHRKTLWGNKKRLLYETPVCHPQIESFPTKGKKAICCICGQESVCSDVSQPSFLLFASPTATLSFNSEGKKPDKICWECEFLSKFAVESAHYKSSDDNLYILQIATGHAKKLIDSHAVLGSQSAVRQLDMDNYLSNIGTYKVDNRLLYYGRLPYELLWAFFHDTYGLLRAEAETRARSQEELTILCTRPFIETPLQLILLVVSAKGQTFMLKEIIAYTETAYVFRLLHSVREEFSSDHKFLYKVFQDLYLPEAGKAFDINNNLWRNRILQRVLQKKPIVQDVEQLAFRKSLQQPYPYIGNLLEFTRHYQFIIQEGWGMTKEQVEVAVNLGRQIVISAKEAAKDVSDSNFDRVKGDLFSLRKTRTVSDFLEQLNRIQFRYNITVSNQILGGILEEPDVSFADFKSYCLLAALNTYNNFKRPKEAKELAN